MTGLEPADFGRAAKPTDATDEFTGIRRQTMSTAPLPGGLGDRVYFTIIHSTGRQTLGRSVPIADNLTTRLTDGSTNILLEVNYTGYGSTGGGWLFIEDGQSLVFLIDGQPHTLRTAGPPRRDLGIYSRVEERAYYPITLDLCEAIANANSVKVRLIGRHYLDRMVPPKAQQVFREFAQRFSPTPLSAKQ